MTAIKLSLQLQIYKAWSLFCSSVFNVWAAVMSKHHTENLVLSVSPHFSSILCSFSGFDYHSQEDCCPELTDTPCPHFLYFFVFSFLSSSSPVLFRTVRAAAMASPQP